MYKRQEICDPECKDNTYCSNGTCKCYPGFTGENCNEFDGPSEWEELWNCLYSNDTASITKVATVHLCWKVITLTMPTYQLARIVSHKMEVIVSV